MMQTDASTIAMIPCAGFGTRMKHLTENTPKPLLTIDRIPLIDFALYQCWFHGIRTVMINTHYKARQIEEYVQGLKWFDIRLSYEEKILGTAGGLSTVYNYYSDLNFYTETILLINPDTIFFPVEDLFSRMRKLCFSSSQCKTVLSLSQAGKNSSETKLSLNHNSDCTFSKDGNWYYTGFGIVRPSLLSTIPSGQKLELGPVWKELSEPPGGLSGIVYEGIRLDCGTLEEYNLLASSFHVPDNHLDSWHQFQDTIH